MTRWLADIILSTAGAAPFWIGSPTCRYRVVRAGRGPLASSTTHAFKGLPSEGFMRVHVRSRGGGNGDNCGQALQATGSMSPSSPPGRAQIERNSPRDDPSDERPYTCTQVLFRISAAAHSGPVDLAYSFVQNEHPAMLDPSPIPPHLALSSSRAF